MALLGLAVVLASSLTAAPGLPEEGRVLDVTFGKSPTESVTHGKVKFDADSKTWRAGCDSLAGREAKYSIVITYRVEKVDSLTAVELVRLYNGNAYEQGFTFRDGLLSIYRVLLSSSPSRYSSPGTKKISFSFPTSTSFGPRPWRFLVSSILPLP